MSEPSPKYIARAIGNALGPSARSASAYLDEWGILARAGVPAEHARAVLDQKRQETSSTLAIAQWDGRGWLGLCGDYGPGKTFAAACWLLDQSRRGRTICWLNAVRWAQLDLDDQTAAVRRATASQAFVFDDLGAGVTKRKVAGKQDWFAQQLEGVIMDRASKPTITASNEGTDEVIDWLGQRLLDRLRQCGELRQIRGPSMREKRADPHDDKGRSPRWARARKLVDALGIRWASVWDDGRDVEHVVVGERLELRTDSRYRASLKPGPEARVHALAEALELASRYSLDIAALTVAALELEATDPAAKLLAKVQDTLDQDTPLARSKRRFANALEADNNRRSRVCQETLEAMTTRLRGEADPGTVLPDREPAAWTTGPKGLEKMRAMKYRVVPLGDGLRGYEVRHGKGAGRMILPAHGSEALAWQALRVLLTPPPPPKDDDAAAAVIAAARAAHGLS